MKTQTDYNQIVNVAEDGEITVLNYVFTYPDMRGAVGSNFYPVSTQAYKERIKKANVIEFLEGCYTDVELLAKYPYCRTVESALNRLYRDMKDAGELEQFMFDTSYNELWNYLREALNLDDKQAYIFECIGGGRCFDKDYQGNFNSELSAIIREYEAPVTEFV